MALPSDVDTVEVPDEELAAEALAADPDAPLPHDAVPFRSVADDADADGILPDWYMPAPALGRNHSAARKRIAVVIVVALVLLNAAGLCSTYGLLELA